MVSEFELAVITPLAKCEGGIWHRRLDSEYVEFAAQTDSCYTQVKVKGKFKGTWIYIAP